VEAEHVGYWLLAENGSIRGYGSAPSATGFVFDEVASPVVALAPARGGRGVWILDRTGTVQRAGDAPRTVPLPDASINFSAKSKSRKQTLMG